MPIEAILSQPVMLGVGEEVIERKMSCRPMSIVLANGQRIDQLIPLNKKYYVLNSGSKEACLLSQVYAITITDGVPIIIARASKHLWRNKARYCRKV